MIPSNNGYTATRFTATGSSCITSGNAALIGVLFTGTGTGSIQLFAGTTVSASVCGIIRAYTTVANQTVNSPLWITMPAYCSGGVSATVGGSADPDVTLYWNPA